MKVEEFLRSKKIPYTKRHHPEAFTAQEIAAVSHVPGLRLLKAVVVKAKTDFALAVCPASYRVDLDKVSKLAGGSVRLANEGEMEAIFKDVELGAEAPIGALYGLKTFVDKSVAANEQVVFQAGTHADTVEISYADFSRAADPVVGEFAEHL